ncbi:class I SAM-dependent methyltransferase [Haloarcula salinisoli]|uniref:Class I SAM-dependent methyltransferase n=1 Tax=Haloarcula salinisoli TaxID=2487746 RepID=A0A8J7YFY6_9EURY|nr:class I SAM-dependent methyltransferase [Halomicroarcula salinisoli]MBX0287819.1 class I SAM-dependent methyltransferase [Halomicroarcula salinisoli]MBX0304762.1 class I SAM-dependent methyltransferase [Halomicroarcula salinisoli]
MREMIQKFNRKINSYLGPKRNGPSRIEIYLDILENSDFDRALHLGSGRDERGIAKRLQQSGVEVIALDPDKGGLSDNELQNRIAGDGQRLPFRDNSIDLVFSEYVFEHLPEPELALNEIHRVLATGGSFVVLVPNPKHYYAIVADRTPFEFHLFWSRLLGKENPERDKFPTQYNWGTYSDIKNLEWGKLEEFYSFPGPTSYTNILPFHFLFVIFDRLVENRPEYHVSYIAKYTL